MNPLHLPWLDLAIAVTMIGFPCVSQMHNPDRIYRSSLAFTVTAFACTVLAWLAFYTGVPAELLGRFSVQPALFGRQIFVVDELNAPLLPTVALMHFLTALATARTFMRRYSFTWSMAA
jgi:NADH-quinone oxidoreductase subunit M